MDGLPLGLAIETDEGTFTITPRQDVRTLWHDVAGPDGDQWASYPTLEGAIEYVTGAYRSDDGSDPTLGSCGCTDYHMSDCPIRTG